MDNEGCDPNGTAIDDRVYSVLPFGGLGLGITLFPGLIGRREAPAWWAHLGFHGEYGHSLRVVTARDYRLAPYADGNRENCTTDGGGGLTCQIDTFQQDFKAHLLGWIPLPRPAGAYVVLALGTSMYQYSLDQNDYPEDELLVPEHQRSNPYLPTFTYLTADLGGTVHLPIKPWLVPYLSLLVRYGVDKVRYDIASHYPISQASRIYGIRNELVGLKSELGIRFRLPLGFQISGSLQVMWWRTMYAELNLHRLRDSEEEAIWNDALVFGNVADDIVVRLRLAIGWAH
jgi:hypothetical protein